MVSLDAYPPTPTTPPDTILTINGPPPSFTLPADPEALKELVLRAPVIRVPACSRGCGSQHDGGPRS
jgi:hypothetical protein